MEVYMHMYTASIRVHYMHTAGISTPDSFRRTVGDQTSPDLAGEVVSGEGNIYIDCREG